jgi:hypothetical protein
MDLASAFDIAIKRYKSKESKPKGPNFGLSYGRGLSMTLLCLPYSIPP